MLSRPGLGSRFTVYLPVDREARLDLRPIILCVEHNGNMGEKLQSLLRGADNTSIEATNDPGSVLAYVEEHPEVDIVLSEIEMPGMSGWDLLERIKSRFPLIAVILYSTPSKALKQKSDNTSQPDCLLEGAVQLDQLLQVIHTMGRQRL